MTKQLKLFVNYRRADELTFVELLRTHFMFRYGRENVFMDFDSIPPFTHFEEFIRQKVRECDIVVPIIGSRWIELLHAKQTDEKPDYVRIELEEALRAGKVITPICIQGANVPPLDDVPAELQSIFGLNIPSISGGRDIINNVGWLMDNFERTLAERGIQREAANAGEDAALKQEAQEALTMADFSDRFSAAVKAQDYPQALIWAAEMRGAGVVPGFFKLDEREGRIRDLLKQQEEQRRRYEVVTYLYRFVRHMVTMEDEPALIDAALAEVWAIEPDFDPDGYGARAREAEQERIAREKAEQERSATLQRARTFTGKRNADWQPFITTFDDLKIPDMPFCMMPVGTFQMGSNDGENNEKPVHTQTFAAPYWLAQYPVTNAQWAQAVKAGVVKQPQDSNSLKWYQDRAKADCPVVGVSWVMARDFAAWLGGRLPAEAEWEYAARGLDSLVYPWGNQGNPDNAVWSRNSNKQTANVGSIPAGRSWVGALDMSGNVWEWVSSLYLPYNSSDDREADAGNRTDVQRVVRGGSWVNADTNLRGAARSWNNADYEDDYYGFRCARST